ncbi:MAG: prephenate dehydratase [Alphaproteobacteria bacterium]|nr:prephenate dehydratase [Alphaproteobacteria bacterium]
MDQVTGASEQETSIISNADQKPLKIAFQGQPGAYSHMACQQACPEFEAIPAETFDDAFTAVSGGRTERAMIAIDNSVAGRVADVHHLMPRSGLHIVGEHFQRVNHHLLALPGTRIDQLRVVHSHVHALNQCRKLLRQLPVTPKVHADTAGSAAEVAETKDPSQAAIASRLAAKIYGLEILKSDIEDADHNTTRFVILAAEPITPAFDPEHPTIMSFFFQVQSVPAALYKALGGFATNGVNMLKLESYVDAEFNQAQFYAEILGHPAETSVKNAMDELRFFSHSVEELGTYPAHPFRAR